MIKTLLLIIAMPSNFKKKTNKILVETLICIHWQKAELFTLSSKALGTIHLFLIVWGGVQKVSSFSVISILLFFI